MVDVKEQKKKHTRVRTDVEKSVNAEEERERKTRALAHHQGPPKSFRGPSGKRERERDPKQIKRTVYFPDRITTCKRLLIPSCAFFDETLDDIMNLFYFAFLSSDAANVLCV